MMSVGLIKGSGRCSTMTEFLPRQSEWIVGLGGLNLVKGGFLLLELAQHDSGLSKLGD